MMPLKNLPFLPRFKFEAHLTLVEAIFRMTQAKALDELRRWEQAFSVMFVIATDIIQ